MQWNEGQLPLAGKTRPILTKGPTGERRPIPSAVSTASTLLHLRTRTCVCGALFDLRAALQSPPPPCPPPGRPSLDPKSRKYWAPKAAKRIFLWVTLEFGGGGGGGRHLVTAPPQNRRA